jgi:hypothetical protein
MQCGAGIADGSDGGGDGDQRFLVVDACVDVRVGGYLNVAVDD